jgi:tetratricopeptide (TPR) repeat protein
MQQRRLHLLILVLLASAVFSAATLLAPRAEGWCRRDAGDGILKVLLGDGRRLFANHFFVKADISFHSGYYPSIFDQSQAPRNSKHLTAAEGTHEEEQEHERQMSFLDKPRDWIEAFGRRFMITRHTHLGEGKEREILPWLKLSAELDPQRVDTYTVAAYWLRSRLGKVREAEQFLREGLRANPGNCELLFEMGRLYHENYHDAVRAYNLWELALRNWQIQEARKAEPNQFLLEEIATHLAHIEEQDGMFEQAIEHLEIAKKPAPIPEPIQRQIDELKEKLESQKSRRPGSGKAQTPGPGSGGRASP